MRFNYKPLWQKSVVRFLGLMATASRVVPMSLLLKFGERLGVLAYSLDKRYRKVALRNLDIAFGPSLCPKEKLRIVRRVFVNFAKAAVEFPAASVMSPTQIRRMVYLDTSDLERLRCIVANCTGLVAFSAHFGNFEIMARRLALEGFKFTVVVRNDSNEAMADAVNALRKRSGYDVIGRGDSRGLLRRLRSNEMEVIAVLPDQKSDDVFVPFFGKLCGTVAGPAVLSRMTGCPILPLFCVRMHNDSHRIVVGEPIMATKTSDKEADQIRVMAQVTGEIEEMVRLYPEQWLWLHDRWRVKPSEEDEARWQAKRLIPA